MRRYGPYPTKSGHLFWIDVHDNGTRSSVWVHREMLEQHLGRKLTQDEVVHHVNEIPDDNRIDNFEIKTRAAHTRDHCAPAEVVEFWCAECGELGFQLARNVKHNRKQGKAGPFCNRTCSGRYSRRAQLGRVS